jgi:hypothetical protein
VINISRDSAEYDYDVCLSFAGEDRDYVRCVADALRKKGIRVFFDEYEEVGLWGKDLYVHLDDVYKNAAQFCVVFISSYYANKLWTNHERRSAQERAFNENKEYILPARFDDTAIPGIRDTVGYIDLHNHNPLELSELIEAKVKKPSRKDYLPPIPDVLFQQLGVESEEEKKDIYNAAIWFLRCLKRMTPEERSLLFDLIINGCPGEMPNNMHINIDLLRRVSGLSPSKIKRLLFGIQSLGFHVFLREDDETEGRIGQMEMLVVEWYDMSENGLGNATDVAVAMIDGVMAICCEKCGKKALEELDFSHLATATSVKGEHAHESR